MILESGILLTSLVDSEEVKYSFGHGANCCTQKNRMAYLGVQLSLQMGIAMLNPRWNQQEVLGMTILQWPKACEMESFGQKRNAFLIGWWYTYPSEK